VAIPAAAVDPLLLQLLCGASLLTGKQNDVLSADIITLHTVCCSFPSKDFSKPSESTQI
jgi:hypothetical protein